MTAPAELYALQQGMVPQSADGPEPIPTDVHIPRPIPPQYPPGADTAESGEGFYTRRWASRQWDITAGLAAMPAAGTNVQVPDRTRPLFPVRSLIIDNQSGFVLCLFAGEQRILILPGFYVRPAESLPVDLAIQVISQGIPGTCLLTFCEQPLPPAAVLPPTNTPSTYRISAALANGVIKASPANVLGWATLLNTNAAVRYVQLYNKFTVPTLGTDTPFLTVAIPAGGAANLFLPNPIFTGANGLSWAVTTDNAAIPAVAGAAGDIAGTILYQ